MTPSSCGPICDIARSDALRFAAAPAWPPGGPAIRVVQPDVMLGLRRARTVSRLGSWKAITTCRPALLSGVGGSRQAVAIERVSRLSAPSSSVCKTRATRNKRADHRLRGSASAILAGSVMATASAPGRSRWPLHAGQGTGRHEALHLWRMWSLVVSPRSAAGGWRSPFVGRSPGCACGRSG